MAVTRWPSSIIVIGAVLAAAACMSLCERRARAEAVQPADPDLTKAKFYGATRCALCHTSPGENFDTEFVLLNEFKTWRTKDKHALAFVVLQGPRGQQMAKLLDMKVTEDPRCLNCHATASRPEREGKAYTKLEGVSCDGCHGPAEHWDGDHSDISWRSKSPEYKEKKGMFDVRNPIKRTQMCISCHVGNTSEGKVVTHEMMAAGHPPLPSFETASFSKNLPQHWRNLKDVPFFNDKKTKDEVRKQNAFDDAPFQQTKLVLASCSQTMRSMMELVANRSDHEQSRVAKTYSWPPPWLQPYAKNDFQDRWPELGKGAKKPGTEDLQVLWPEIAMAQSDCYSCHHDLKSKSWRQERGYEGRPGRPQIQQWPFALAATALPANAAPEFDDKIKKLRLAVDSAPFGTPKELTLAATDLEHFAAKLVQPSETITREKAGDLLKKLVERGSPKDAKRSTYLDYDSARQIAWAARAVFSEWGTNHPNKKEIEKIFSDLDDMLNLSLDSKARKGATEERYKLTADLGTLKATKKLEDPAFQEELKRISDVELNEALKVIASYEPEQFRGHMQALARLIFAKSE